MKIAQLRQLEKVKVPLKNFKMKLQPKIYHTKTKKLQALKGLS